MRSFLIEEAKEIAYKEVVNFLIETHYGDDFEEECEEDGKEWFLKNNYPVFIDEETLDFYWGFVFYYDGKKAIEENDSDYSYFFSPPILIDKFTGESFIIPVRTNANANANGWIILDNELEKYRKSKGYDLTIKFPIVDGIEKLPLKEQIKCYFRSGEFLQVKMGLSLMEENKFIELEEFKKIVYHANFVNDDRTFEEHIIKSFEFKEKLTFWAVTGIFFEDVQLFEDTKELFIGDSKLSFIGSSITKLQQVKTITFRESEVLELSPDIKELENLEKITIWDSKIAAQPRALFEELKLEKGIEIVIFSMKN